MYDTVPLIGWPEFKKCTTPLGPTPRLVVFTVAVKVTGWPDVVLVGLGVTEMVVGA